MRRIFYISLFLIIFGCQSSQRNTVVYDTQKFDLSSYSISANCEIYNLQGEAIRKYPGDQCVFYENGDLLISDLLKLQKLNKFNQVIWSYSAAVHHQMHLSFNKKEIYFISTYYKPRGKDMFRHDVVEVLDENGKKIKYFDFSKFTDSLSPQQHKIYKYGNYWHNQPLARYSFEYTHVNSIYEIINTDVNGQKKLDGYIVNDRGTRRIFVLEPDLKKIRNVIHLDFEVIHDASFLNKDWIIYYANNNRAVKNRSYVTSVNVNTLEKKIIYNGPEGGIYSMNNGGVHSFTSDLLLVSHSEEGIGSSVEIVTLKGQSLKRIYLNGSRKLIQDAKLVDHSDFLKNNIGN